MVSQILCLPRLLALTESSLFAAGKSFWLSGADAGRIQRQTDGHLGKAALESWYRNCKSGDAVPGGAFAAHMLGARARRFWLWLWRDGNR